MPHLHAERAWALQTSQFLRGKYQEDRSCSVCGPGWPLAAACSIVGLNSLPLAATKAKEAAFLTVNGRRALEQQVLQPIGEQNRHKVRQQRVGRRLRTRTNCITSASGYSGQKSAHVQNPQ